MTTLNTEELLSAALDADPGNHLLRYALADCLDESAGTVACGRCDGLGLYARQRGLLNFDPMECPNCSGTGRVSDGRRERAEGLRVLAQLGRVPDSEGGQWVWWGQGFIMASGKAGGWLPTKDPASLPWEWRQAVNGDRWDDETNGARYPTRREAEGAAALAWPTLPADVRAAILGAAR
jgi:hypothetical protein